MLRAIPGVVHVSVGLKQTKGKFTDVFAIRVYVAEKMVAWRCNSPSTRTVLELMALLDRSTTVNELIENFKYLVAVCAWRSGSVAR